MLSRVASSLYWMSRYVERAENTVRLVDVNLQLLLDVRNLDDRALASHWMPILKSTGDDELFFELHPTATGAAVTDFLVFESANPNSVLASLNAARENARMARDQVSADVWEELNRLYLFLRSPRARTVWSEAPHEFFNEIKSSTLQLHGLTDTTQVRNEGWFFAQAGRHLERADKTSRLLDVRSIGPAGSEVPGMRTQDEILGWSAVLRSSSAWDAYKLLHGSELRFDAIVELLLLSEDFPRSVRFCIQQLNYALRRISGVAEGRFSNAAEKHSGRLLAELQFSSAADVLARGLHDYIDDLQVRLNAVGDELFQTYIFNPYHSFADGELRQQQEQQQQSGTSRRTETEDLSIR